MNVRLVPIAMALVGLAACVAEDAQLLVPEDVELTWDESFNRADDGIGALVPVDVMVYEAATGEPLFEVALDLQSDAASSLVVHPDMVELVEPTLDDTLQGEPLWDTWQDRYFELASEGDVEFETDDTGLVRAYVWVDSFEEYEPVVITVSGIGAELSETFTLIPR